MMLQNGSVFGQSYQSYKSRIPFIQQLLIDYNPDDTSCMSLSQVDYSVGSYNPQNHILINISKLTLHQLEVDACVNQLIVADRCLSASPSIVAFWEDEGQRHRNKNLDLQLFSCISQTRKHFPPSISHNMQKQSLQERLCTFSINISSAVTPESSNIFMASATQNHRFESFNASFQNMCNFEVSGSNISSLNITSNGSECVPDSDLPELCRDLSDVYVYNKLYQRPKLVDKSSYDDGCALNLLSDINLYKSSDKQNREVQLTIKNKRSFNIPQLDGAYDTKQTTQRKRKRCNDKSKRIKRTTPRNVLHRKSDKNLTVVSSNSKSSDFVVKQVVTDIAVKKPSVETRKSCKESEIKSNQSSVILQKSCNMNLRNTIKAESSTSVCKGIVLHRSKKSKPLIDSPKRLEPNKATNLQEKQSLSEAANLPNSEPKNSDGLKRKVKKQLQKLSGKSLKQDKPPKGSKPVNAFDVIDSCDATKYTTRYSLRIRHNLNQNATCTLGKDAPPNFSVAVVSHTVELQKGNRKKISTPPEMEISKITNNGRNNQNNKEKQPGKFGNKVCSLSDIIDDVARATTSTQSLCSSPPSKGEKDNLMSKLKCHSKQNKLGIKRPQKKSVTKKKSSTFSADKINDFDQKARDDIAVASTSRQSLCFSPPVKGDEDNWISHVKGTNKQITLVIMKPQKKSVAKRKCSKLLANKINSIDQAKDDLAFASSSRQGLCSSPPLMSNLNLKGKNKQNKSTIMRPLKTNLNKNNSNKISVDKSINGSERIIDRTTSKGLDMPILDLSTDNDVPHSSCTMPNFRTWFPRTSNSYNFSNLKKLNRLPENRASYRQFSNSVKKSTHNNSVQTPNTNVTIKPKFRIVPASRIYYMTRERRKRRINKKLARDYPNTVWEQTLHASASVNVSECADNVKKEMCNTETADTINTQIDSDNLSNSSSDQKEIQKSQERTCPSPILNTGRSFFKVSKRPASRLSSSSLALCASNKSENSLSSFRKNLEENVMNEEGKRKSVNMINSSVVNDNCNLSRKPTIKDENSTNNNAAKSTCSPSGRKCTSSSESSSISISGSQSTSSDDSDYGMRKFGSYKNKNALKYAHTRQKDNNDHLKNVYLGDKPHKSIFLDGANDSTSSDEEAISTIVAKKCIFKGRSSVKTISESSSNSSLPVYCQTCAVKMNSSEASSEETNVCD